MVPRADIEAVEIDTTLGELLNLFEQSGHSRMPVYSETLDDPRGMVHIRDVMSHITRPARTRKGRGARASRPGVRSISPRWTSAKSLGELNLIRSVLFVPPSMLASDLMARMQATRTQMALVIDEYGGTDGLVSLEDIVEMVVGDIEDEHDDDEPLITQAGEGVFIVDAKAEIDDVAQEIGDDFTPASMATMSTRSAAWSSTRSAASRRAARWCRRSPASSSRCSMPTRAASSESGSSHARPKAAASAAAGCADLQQAVKRLLR